MVPTEQTVDLSPALPCEPFIEAGFEYFQCGTVNGDLVPETLFREVLPAEEGTADQWKKSTRLLRAWAWEFLRRRLDYQLEYFRFSQLPPEVLRAMPQRGRGWSMNWWECYPPASPGETCDHYLERVEDSHEATSPHTAFCRKWGLTRPRDPKRAWNDGKVPPRFRSVRKYSLKNTPADQPNKRVVLTIFRHHLLAMIDLRDNPSSILREIEYEVKSRAIDSEEIPHNLFYGLPLISPVTPLRSLVNRNFGNELRFIDGYIFRYFETLKASPSEDRDQHTKPSEETSAVTPCYSYLSPYKPVGKGKSVERDLTAREKRAFMLMAGYRRIVFFGVGDQLPRRVQVQTPAQDVSSER